MKRVTGGYVAEGGQYFDTESGAVKQEAEDRLEALLKKDVRYYGGDDYALLFPHIVEKAREYAECLAKISGGNLRYD